MSSVSRVGIIANPASGKDIRRLVAHGSTFDNNEKTNIVRRVLLGDLAELRASAAHVGRHAHDRPEEVLARLAWFDAVQLARDGDEDLLCRVVRIRRGRSKFLRVRR